MSEISPPHTGGLLVGLQGVCIVWAYIIGSCLALGFSFVTESHQWRLNYIIATVFRIPLFASLFFLPEPPRWLVETRQRGRGHPGASAPDQVGSQGDACPRGDDPDQGAGRSGAVSPARIPPYPPDAVVAEEVRLHRAGVDHGPEHGDQRHRHPDPRAVRVAGLRYVLYLFVQMLPPTPPFSNDLFLFLFPSVVQYIK